MEEGSVQITGGSGQMGRATIKALVDRGVEPTALVRKEVQLDGCAIIPDWLKSEDAIAAGRLSDRRPPRRGYRTFECAVLRRG